MGKGLVVAFLVMAVCFQARGDDGGRVPANAMSASQLTTDRAQKNSERIIGSEPRLLISQASAIPPTRTHRVMLSWIPGVMTTVSEPVAGYNVYRCNNYGSSWIKINPDLVMTPEYVDYHVHRGRTYFYATTTVGESGKQSGFSNQVKVVIPSP